MAKVKIVGRGMHYRLGQLDRKSGIGGVMVVDDQTAEELVQAGLAVFVGERESAPFKPAGGEDVPSSALPPAQASQTPIVPSFEEVLAEQEPQPKRRGRPRKSV